MYEMVSGHAAFPGETASDVIAAILKTEPQSLAGAPQEFDRIVHRCLKKDREQHYGSAEAVLGDLKNLKREVEAQAVRAITQTPKRRLFISRFSLAVMLFGILVLTALGYLLLTQRATMPAPSEIKSLAVLPLQNLSGDPEQEYFADGMTETLISNLTQIRALNRVISRTSVMRYKGSQKSLPEIAAELKVDAVIEGTVQRSVP